MKTATAIGWGLGLIILVGACAYVGGFAYRAAVEPEQKVETPVGGGGFSLDQAYYFQGSGAVTAATTSAGEISATTTLSWLATNQTSTSSIQGFTGRATGIDLNMLAVATTSGTSKLQFFVYFSHNKIDWYKEDCSSVASTVLVTHGASACVHEWTITGAGTQSKNITIGATQAKYFKIDFGVTGANASLWAMAIPKEVTPN